MSDKIKQASLLLSLQLLAFWPVWYWYTLRLRDSTDELWGIVALISAIFAFFFSNPKLREIRWGLSSFFILVYAALFHTVPPLVRAIFAMTAIILFLRSFQPEKSVLFQIWGLLLLSLPVIPTMQFYLGYPLRVIVGSAASGLLQISGFPVFREGVCLNWNNNLIWIDAPCSGVKMMWAGFFLTFILANFYKLNIKKTTGMMFLSFAVILIGNILRTSALFFVEGELFSFPSWFHVWTGIVAFTFIGMSITILTHVIKSTGGNICGRQNLTS